MNVVFDLDGVILDSQAAIIDAYRVAGVDAPTNIHAGTEQEY